MANLGAAVIGCGVIGPVHASAFAAIPGVQLRTVCDLQPERAERLAADYHAHAATDCRRVLEDPAIHVVSIGTPHPIHRAIFEAAVKAGKAVICEKPLASTFADLDAMIGAAGAARYATAGVFQHRFSPVVAQLNVFLRQGAFGKPLKGRLNFRCRRGIEYYRTDAWRGKAVEEGGGVLINQAIHFVDLLNYFLGWPTAVKGEIGRTWVPEIEVEDWAKARVSYAGGVTAELDIANVKEKTWQCELTIQCERGAFSINADHKLTAQRGLTAGAVADLQSAAEEEKSLPISPGKPEYGPWHLAQFRDFIDASRTGRPPRLTLPEAAVSNRLVLATYLSAQTGREHDLTRPYNGPYAYKPIAPPTATSQVAPPGQDGAPASTGIL